MSHQAAKYSFAGVMLPFFQANQGFFLRQSAQASSDMLLPSRHPAKGLPAVDACGRPTNGMRMNAMEAFQSFIRDGWASQTVSLKQTQGKCAINEYSLKNC